MLKQVASYLDYGTHSSMKTVKEKKKKESIKPRKKERKKERKTERNRRGEKPDGEKNEATVACSEKWGDNAE